MLVFKSGNVLLFYKMVLIKEMMTNLQIENLSPPLIFRDFYKLPFKVLN